ncbi:MAG: hypothetical protein RJQ03_07390 [Miltoncostaeaceae bacterium]
MASEKPTGEAPADSRPGGLVYLDILGTRNLWRSGNEAAVSKAYETVRSLVTEALTGTQSHVTGNIRSDSVILAFDDAAEAVGFGERLFLGAFLRASKASRLWLRGVVVPCVGSSLSFADRTQLTGDWDEVSVTTYSDELLGAVFAEAGIKGPRLLVHESVQELTTAAVRRQHKEFFFHPLRRLACSPYPSDDWADLLYLAPWPFEEAAINARGKAVRDRIKWAAANGTSPGISAELEQLAYLASVWAETRDIMFSQLNAAARSG